MVTVYNLELIIINDGSTDNTLSIIKKYEKQDNRIRVISRENKGIAASINEGIYLAKGKYIARMDADDISFPNRLEKQFSFMEANPEIGVCGSWIKVCKNEKEEIWKYPIKDEELKSRLITEPPFCHPTVIYRKSLFEKTGFAYDSGYDPAEDYNLWSMLSKLTFFANLPEPLLFYRLHTNQATNRDNDKSTLNAKRVQINVLAKLELYPTEKELTLHNDFRYKLTKTTKKEFLELNQWLEKIYSANTLLKVFPEVEFNKMLADGLFTICYNSPKINFWICIFFLRSNLSKIGKVSWKRKLRLILRCLKPKIRFPFSV